MSVDGYRWSKLKQYGEKYILTLFTQQLVWVNLYHQLAGWYFEEILLVSDKRQTDRGVRIVCGDDYFLS